MDCMKGSRASKDGECERLICEHNRSSFETCQWALHCPCNSFWKPVGEKQILKEGDPAPTVDAAKGEYLLVHEEKEGIFEGEGDDKKLKMDDKGMPEYTLVMEYQPYTCHKCVWLIFHY